nr:hypothetical protein [Actinomadura formosensis]
MPTPSNSVPARHSPSPRGCGTGPDVPVRSAVLMIEKAGVIATGD